MDQNDKIMESELNKITELVDKFNKSDYKFIIEIHLNKKQDEKLLKLDQIMDIVCRKTGLTPEYLRMETREPRILIPRQICHYLGKHRTKKTLSEVGSYFGNKDHATVLSSSRKIQNLLDTEKKFRDFWREVLNS